LYLNCDNCILLTQSITYTIHLYYTSYRNCPFLESSDNNYIKNRYLLSKIQSKIKQKFNKRINLIYNLLLEKTKLYKDLLNIVLKYSS